MCSMSRALRRSFAFLSRTILRMNDRRSLPCNYMRRLRALNKGKRDESRRFFDAANSP